MAIHGERLTGVTRRLRTPSTTEWEDGRFIDAGLAAIVNSNLAHLQRESVRHLVTALGPGAVANEVRGYYLNNTALQDRFVPPSGFVDEAAIAWGVSSSACFGPFTLIGDREETDQHPTWRNIRVRLDCTGTALTVFAAFTEGSLPSPGHQGFVQQTITAGRTFADLLLPPARSLVAARVACRDPGGATAEDVFTVTGVLWVGWYSASGSSAVYTISADEVL